MSLYSGFRPPVAFRSGPIHTHIAKCCYSRNALNLSLTPELERFFDAKVESGLYNNAE
jgi:hypothetical protein